MDLAIYGAQGMALAVYEAFKCLYPKRHVRCFLVTSLKGNASVLGDIPVKELAAFSSELLPEDRNNLAVLIATPEDVQAEIEESLENYGFRNYRRLDSQRWSELMKLYHARLGRFLPLSALPFGCNEAFIRIFVARSYKDRKLRCVYQLPDYMRFIQVGAGSGNKRVGDFHDDEGDNISAKNGNYSELTALYWIWKNRLSGTENQGISGRQYYGLAQYRRMLRLDRDDLLRLLDNDVDVVLPYPMPYEPDINAHHTRYLKDSDWRAMLRALEELQPEYAKVLRELMGQKYLYNYNVILAKKDVLQEYCSWLFPILERTEELSVPKGCERSDRYIGYLGETLETLYFIKNADRLNIVHAECVFYV